MMTLDFRKLPRAPLENWGCDMTYTLKFFDIPGGAINVPAMPLFEHRVTCSATSPMTGYSLRDVIPDGYRNSYWHTIFGEYGKSEHPLYVMRIERYVTTTSHKVWYARSAAERDDVIATCLLYVDSVNAAVEKYLSENRPWIETVLQPYLAQLNTAYAGSETMHYPLHVSRPAFERKQRHITTLKGELK